MQLKSKKLCLKLLKIKTCRIIKDSQDFTDQSDVKTHLKAHQLAITLLLPLIFAFATVTPSSAAPGAKSRELIQFEGQVSGAKSARDKKKRRFWQYQLKLSSGESVLVHDYQLGKTRTPASAGLKSGRKKKVKGFFVTARTQAGDTTRNRVLIVSAP
jgi:hypothetical protein